MESVKVRFGLCSLRVALFAISCFVVLAGCGSKGGGGTPTSPSSTDTPPPAPAPLSPLAAPSGIRFQSINIRDRAADLSWNAVADATSYIVDVGTSAGSSDIRVITTGNRNTSLALSDLPAGGFVWARVRAQQDDRTSTPSFDVRVYLQDYKYLVEALMLQTGPYYPVAAPFDGVRGWPAGTTVRIRLSNTISPEQRRGIDGVVAQLAQSGAPYRATVEVMNSNRASVVRNEIQVVTAQNACETGLGCTGFADTSMRQRQDAQIFGSAYIYLGSASERGNAADVAAHEMGHALVGLWHVHYQKVPEAPQFPSQFGTLAFPHLIMYSQMESVFRSPLDRLSDLEMQVAQDAFRSGISAGSRRADLKARDLIH